MSTAGVDSPLGEVLASIRSVMAETEVDGLDALSAARIVEECAEAERLLAAFRVLSAATLEDKALWRREGFRSVGTWMASKTGTAVGAAIGSLEMAAQLADLPLVAEAFLAGRLSDAQARQTGRVAVDES